MWQDIVIAVIQWALLLALLPSIFHPSHKPALWSSLFTGTMLVILSATFWTLELTNATLASTAVAIAWFILAWQRVKLNKGETDET